MVSFRCSCLPKTKNFDSENDVIKGPATPTSKTVKVSTNSDANSSIRSLFYFDAMTEQEEENLATSMYFDARQSHTASMIYRPATPNASSIRTFFSLETDAESSRLLMVDSSSDSPDSPRDSGILMFQKSKARFPMQPGYPGKHYFIHVICYVAKL